MNKSILFSIAFAGMLFSALPAGAQVVPSARIAGETRFETAIATSQQMYPKANTAPGAFIARADDPADSITVAPLAKQWGNQPVLITQKDRLHPGTKAELKRLIQLGGAITIVGGPDAVSKQVEKELGFLGFHVQRIEGKNRSDTAVKIADEVHTMKPVQQVFIADMHTWAEGLYWSAIAPHHNGVVLFSDKDTSAPETAQWLKKKTGLKRVAGFINIEANPALTDAIAKHDFKAATVKQAFVEFKKPKEVAIVTHAAFPDALAAAAYMAKVDGPVLFADEYLDAKPLPSKIDTTIQAQKPAMVRVFGGPKAVSENAVKAITDPAWKPGTTNAAGNGCDAPKSQHLPDGTWYGFVVGGEGMPDVGEGSAVVELYYVCYDADLHTWQPAKRWRNRLMWVKDRTVYQTMANDDREEPLGEFTIKNNLVTKYRGVPNIKPLNTVGIESCIVDGCDYWEG